MEKPISYETIISHLDKDPLWDDFVFQTPTAHHEQTSLWGSSQRHAGWHASRLMIKVRGELVGGAQILEKPLGLFGWKAGYLNRGPVIASNAKELTPAILDEIKQYASQRRLVYLAVVPPYDAAAFLSELTAAGFAVSPEFLPPVTTMRSTITLDLTPPEEKILMHMRMKSRQNIRKGLKRGLTVRQGGTDDLDTFKRLLIALCDRRGVKPNVPMGRFLHELWSDFYAAGRAQLFLSEHNGEAVAALWLFATGQWVRAWRYGWSGAYANAYPNELLYWEAIKWSKVRGYQQFDFMGFDTKYAHALHEGRTLPEKEICKPSFFKQGFGGTVLPLYPNYCFSSKPTIRFCLRLGVSGSAKFEALRHWMKMPLQLS